MKRTYQGIEFADGIQMSLAEFEKVYGSNHIFNNMLPAQRKKELKKAFEIATKKDISKPEEEDGDSTGSTDQGKAAQTSANS